VTSERQILICQYTNCRASGSDQVLAAFQAQKVAGVTVSACDCQGQCNMGPTVRVLPDNTWYARIQPTDVSEIVEQHLRSGEPVERLLHPRLHLRFSV